MTAPRGVPSVVLSTERPDAIDTSTTTYLTGAFGVGKMELVKSRPRAGEGRYREERKMRGVARAVICRLSSGHVVAAVAVVVRREPPSATQPEEGVR